MLTYSTFDSNIAHFWNVLKAIKIFIKKSNKFLHFNYTFGGVDFYLKSWFCTLYMSKRHSAFYYLIMFYHKIL